MVNAGPVEVQLTAKGGQFTVHAIGGNRKRADRTERLPWRAQVAAQGKKI